MADVETGKGRRTRRSRATRSQERERPDDAVPSPPVALEAAAERVAEGWDGVPGDADGSSGLRAQLAAVVDLVREALQGESAPEASGRATALRLRLLDALRREMISAPEPEEGEARTLLRELRALESAREALEADWVRRFGLALAGPHGMDVAAEVAHGLRSSCTSLLFVAEVLREGMYGELNPKQRRQVEALYSGAVGLTEALSDLTDLAWRTEEPGEGAPRPLSLRDEVEWIEGILEPMAQAREIDLDVSVPDEARRSGYARPLRRALLGLALHALLSVERGRVRVALRERDPETIEVEVSAFGDDGAGRDDGDDPYRILRRAAGDGELSFSLPGLRLHMARELVEALGGELVYEGGDAGMRARFTLPLPRQDASDTA